MNADTQSNQDRNQKIKNLLEELYGGKPAVCLVAALDSDGLPPSLGVRTVGLSGTTPRQVADMGGALSQVLHQFLITYSDQQEMSPEQFVEFMATVASQYAAGINYLVRLE